MAQQKNTRLEKEQLDAISDMESRGVADNESEAHRMLLRAGMREYGYKNGNNTETALRAFVQRLSELFLIAGIVWTGITWYYPRVYAMPAIGLFLSGLACVGMDRVLESYEPGVSNYLKGFFSRGAA